MRREGLSVRRVLLPVLALAVPTGPSEDSFAPFGALSCAKQLDTQVMACITSIDNRRVWIADEKTGLVFGLSHFRHAMEKTEWPTFGD